ncbi:MAG: class I SAM-dependent methyltransferase [Moraxellaceae bacterium]
MNAAQQAYIEKRLRQIRYWPRMAAGLLLLLLALYGVLFARYPIFVSPDALVTLLRQSKPDFEQLAMLAALGNLAFLATGLLILLLIVVVSMALWNERRLIALLQAPVMPEFKDHFSSLAQDYACYRPHYPATLFTELAALVPDHACACAWDCGTGNGQAAAGLAAHFREVYASDASAEQIAQATAPDNVRFAVAPAEASGLPDASVDLLLVAQAAHWFDLPVFYAEAGRVLRPGGVLALLTYSGLRINAELDPLLREFHEVTVGPYWPPERRHPETGYRDLPFPWPEIEMAPQTMTAAWTLDQLMGYLGTWSSVKAYREQRDEDPLPALRATLLPLWPEAGQAALVLSWPLSMRLGRRP